MSASLDQSLTNCCCSVITKACSITPTHCTTQFNFSPLFLFLPDKLRATTWTNWPALLRPLLLRLLPQTIPPIMIKTKQFQFSHLKKLSPKHWPAVVLKGNPRVHSGKSSKKKRNLQQLKTVYHLFPHHHLHHYHQQQQPVTTTTNPTATVHTTSHFSDAERCRTFAVQEPPRRLTVRIEVTR